jgi:hypothetical protein
LYNKVAGGVRGSLRLVADRDSIILVMVDVMDICLFTLILAFSKSLSGSKGHYKSNMYCQIEFQIPSQFHYNWWGFIRDRFIEIGLNPNPIQNL